MDSSHEQARLKFQDDLDSLHDGETLELSPREFPGPIVIKHPLILDGQRATIWALKGPVVSVESDGVVLRNLRVEVTGEEDAAQPEEECAILVQSGRGILLENVEARGSVIGLPEEEGEWRYPHSLPLGRLAHGGTHDLIMRIAVPVPCRLKSSISGLEVSPHSLKPGINEVQLHIEQLPKDTLLSGLITLSTAFLIRQISVTAHVVVVQPGQPPAIQGNKQVIWEAADWAALSQTPPPPPKPPEPISIAPPQEQPAQVVTPPPVYPPAASQPIQPPAAPASVSVANNPAPAPPAATAPPQPVMPPPTPVSTPAPQQPATQNPVPSKTRFRTQPVNLSQLFSPPVEEKKEDDRNASASTKEAEAAGEKTAQSVLPPVFADPGSNNQEAETKQTRKPESVKPPDMSDLPPNSPRVRSVPYNSLFGQQPAPVKKDESAGAPPKPVPDSKTATKGQETKKKIVRPNNLSSLFTGGGQTDNEKE
ncbi:MAG: hypothetical protein H7Y30_06275 [Pyrinomonadaceae bacterium]|nr:hypothetical protein [Pyrinomonadaceae bacterium]